MRTTLLCILILTVVSCKESQDYCHGIIYDENLKPLSGVTINERKHIVQSTISDEKGYFRLYIGKNFAPDLIFSKPGFETKTVGTIITRYGRIRCIFLNEKADTLILKRIALPDDNGSHEKHY